MNEVTKQKISDLLKTLAIILISFVAAMLIGAIFVVILGKSPLKTYKQLILSPFTNIRRLRNAKSRINTAFFLVKNKISPQGLW